MTWVTLDDAKNKNTLGISWPRESIVDFCEQSSRTTVSQLVQLEARINWLLSSAGFNISEPLIHPSPTLCKKRNFGDLGHLEGLETNQFLAT